MKQYFEVKGIDNLPDYGTISKTSKTEEKLILRTFENNPGLSLLDGQVILRTNGLNISYDTIKSHLLANNVKFHRVLKKTVTVRQTCRKKACLGESKFEPRLGQCHFFKRGFFLNTFFTNSYLVYSCKQTHATNRWRCEGVSLELFLQTGIRDFRYVYSQPECCQNG